MAPILSLVLIFVALLILLPVSIFFAEVTAAVVWPFRTVSGAIATVPPSEVSIAVMIPAHNEGTNLSPTLTNVRRQMGDGNRLLVIADNCSDDTAHVAFTHGAEVIERHDSNRHGKGYALDFGLRHLKSDPPKIVIMIDADCQLAENAISKLVNACAATRRPVQALYLMTAPPDSRSNHRVAEFAWRVKNQLRPLGLAALHLPCQLTGTGMAFPWEALREVNLASGSIVEDIKLGLDLAAKGYAAVFCPSALVTSEFASSNKAARTQRERWEGGHIDMIVKVAPTLFVKAIAQGNWKLFALTLDLAVPPLSLLVLLVFGICVITGLWASFGMSFAPSAISAGCLVLFGLATFIAWCKCGRDLVPFGAVVTIPRYVASKIDFYRAKLFKKTVSEWIKTERRNFD